MKFKQFLKLGWKKIALTIILIPLTFFVFIFLKEFYCGWLICQPSPCSGDLYSIPWECGCPICSLEQPINLYFQTLLIAFYVSFLLLSYLLSCLIVWIYDKVKKK